MVARIPNSTLHRTWHSTSHRTTHMTTISTIFVSASMPAADKELRRKCGEGGWHLCQSTRLRRQLVQPALGKVEDEMRSVHDSAELLPGGGVVGLLELDQVDRNAAGGRGVGLDLRGEELAHGQND